MAAFTCTFTDKSCRRLRSTAVHPGIVWKSAEVGASPAVRLQSRMVAPTVDSDCSLFACRRGHAIPGWCYEFALNSLHAVFAKHRSLSRRARYRGSGDDYSLRTSQVLLELTLGGGNSATLWPCAAHQRWRWSIAALNLNPSFARRWHVSGSSITHAWGSSVMAIVEIKIDTVEPF